MANLTYGTLVIKDGSGTTGTAQTFNVAVDPNHSSYLTPLNGVTLLSGSIWDGTVGVNGTVTVTGTVAVSGTVSLAATQLSATRNNAPGSYPATGLLSDTVDLTAPGILEIWATGDVKFTCLDGSVDTRTIGSGVSLPYQLPVIVTRIWSSVTTIAADKIKILKV